MSSNLDLAHHQQEDDSDEQLMFVYAANPEYNASAFEILFDRYFDRVHAYLMVKGAPPSVTEDLAQEAFVRIVIAAGTFDKDRGSFRAWLFKIATNLFTDYLRETGKRRTVPLEESEAVIGSIPEDVLQLDKFLRNMKPELREPLELFAIGGMTAPEIAKVLHLPEGTIYSRIHRARIKLRKKLDPDSKIKRILKKVLPKLVRPPVRETQASIPFEEDQQ